MELKALLELFGITRSFTDGWGAYERHLEAEQHTVGEGPHPEDREPAHQHAHTNEAVGPSDDLLLQDGTHARLSDWPLYQSV